MTSSLPPEMGVSPGPDIPERERSVIQGQGDQQLSLVYPVALTRRANMLGHGFARYAQNCRDFRISLALGHEKHAVALAIGQNRFAQGKAMTSLQPETPRGFEGECPSAMGDERNRGTFSRIAACKRAGSARFARHMRWYCKATTQALLFTKSKHSVVLGRERNEATDVRPGEALGRYVAGPMHRINHAQRMGVVTFCPALRVIVQPDRSIILARKLTMMGESIVVEAKSVGYFAEQFVEFDNRTHPVRHLFQKFPKRPSRHEVPLRPPAVLLAGLQQGALSPACGPRSNFSGSEAIRLKLSNLYHGSVPLQYRELPNSINMSEGYLPCRKVRCFDCRQYTSSASSETGT